MKEFKLIDAEVNEYFRTARERYRIYLRKRNGDKAPWSEDKAFQDWFFCNVFREDDKTTQWIKEHIREPHRNDPCVIWMMVACRLFNKISTLEILVNEGLFKDGDSWDRDKAEELLRDVKPLTGAGYMVHTPYGMNKLMGCLKLIDDAIEANAGRVECLRIMFRGPAGTPRLEDAHNMLLPADCFGPFMAYEVVTDLRHTRLLENAPDIMTWASIGPGAALGLSRLVGEKVSYGSVSGREAALGCMRQILERAWGDRWPSYWSIWDMRTVEHWLCEHFKYCKVALDKKRMKRKYPVR
ncbi:hypothetical protein LCGC14_0599610 [marine sediment metagenome]|uniref:5-hmdU DNA kinase helical domain-containing protein n=1 Tax=marine sediment metagenome TaxID=412755 RepID=A0A0F9TX36_9ZZZZ